MRTLFVDISYSNSLIENDLTSNWIISERDKDNETKCCCWSQDRYYNSTDSSILQSIKELAHTGKCNKVIIDWYNDKLQKMEL